MPPKQHPHFTMQQCSSPNSSVPFLSIPPPPQPTLSPSHTTSHPNIPTQHPSTHPSHPQCWLNATLHPTSSHSTGGCCKDKLEHEPLRYKGPVLPRALIIGSCQRQKQGMVEPLGLCWSLKKWGAVGSSSLSDCRHGYQGSQGPAGTLGDLLPNSGVGHSLQLPGNAQLGGSLCHQSTAFILQLVP